MHLNDVAFQSLKFNQNHRLIIDNFDLFDFIESFSVWRKQPLIYVKLWKKVMIAC